MTTLIQRSFTSGEITPSLYARVDQSKYATGLKTCRNFMIMRHGGVTNRPGTEFVGEVKDSTKQVRLIPFIFNASQTYVLEFGQYYMRVIKDGAYITDSGSIYELATPYTAAHAQDLKFVQSADVITLVHPSYAVRDLSRTGDAAWSLATVTFAPSISAPTSLSNSGPSGSSIYWKVTAIDADTYEESVASSSTGVGSPAPDRDGIAEEQAMADTGNLILNGDLIVDGVWHCPFVGGRIITVYSNDDDSSHQFTVTGTDKDGNPQSEALVGPNSSTVSTLKYYHTVTRVSINAASQGLLEVGVSTVNYYPLTLSWTAASGADEYNVYKSKNGIYGLIGIAGSTTFEDTDIDPDITDTPPTARNPFSGSNNYPSTVSYFQQRLVFGNTNNYPEKIWTSRVGNYHNFTVSSPLQDDDAITFNLSGRQVNAIQHLLELGKPVVLTNGGEWIVQGNEAGILIPAAINPKQHTYNGSNTLSPIIITDTALYVQARGSIIRDFNYEYQVDKYRGNDITIFSAHLFDGYELMDWCYQQTPHSTVWCVRNDGILLGVTYVKEHQIIGWHRHDFDGLVENVCSIPEGNEDSLYLSIVRTIDNQTVRYIERMNSRQFTDIIDASFVDCGMTYDGRNTTSATMTLSGSGWTYTDTLTLTSSTAYFTSDEIGNMIVLTGSDGEVIRAEITAYTSTTVVSVRPNRTVPASLQATTTATWSRAVDEIGGLSYLEGKEISIFADGFVVANPNNPSYSVVTVINGTINLDKCYSVVHVGLPYTSDIETLDIDSDQVETISDKKMIVTGVIIYVESSRGIWVGANAPVDTTSLTGLTEIKARNHETYEEPIALTTGKMSAIIKPEWNSNGRIFIRQTDPLPLSVLAIAPTGAYPFKKKSGG